MKLKYIVLIGSILLLTNCGTKRKVVTHTPKKPKVTIIKTDDSIKDNQEKTDNLSEYLDKLTKNDGQLNKKTIEYIKKFYPIAVSEMQVHHIPASITLAQGILESGNGYSNLASRSNNHFGIKCHSGWTGARVYHDDDEKGECFRKYQHPDTSYKDHSDFLVNRKRYANLFNFKITDYKRWANGLRKAGYATDKKYPQKLISLIERYQLYKFDTLYKNGTQTNTHNNPIFLLKNNHYRVKSGDTLHSIAKRHKTTVAKLKEINGLHNNHINIGQYLWIR